MPLIHVRTNLAVPEEKRICLQHKMQRAIPLLRGKEESWLMFELTEECFLWFEGTDAPAAMVEVAVLGGLDAADCEALTERVSQEVSEVLQIPMPRIYVRYSQAPYWGGSVKEFSQNGLQGLA